MHPQDAFPLIATKLLFFNFILLLFALTESFFKYTKTKYLYPLVLLATFCLVPYFLNDFLLFCFFDNTWWSNGYILSSAIGFFLFIYIEKWYITGEKPSSANMKIIGILIFITAMFHEFIKFNILATVFIVYIVSLILKNIKINLSDFKHHIAIYSAICLIFVLNLFNNTYIHWFSGHVTINPVNHINYTDFLKDYFKAVVSNIIVPDMYLLITIAVLVICIILFVKDKNKNIKIITTNVSLLFSLIIFLVLSVSAGDNHDGLGKMIAEHDGIKTITVLSFLYIVYSLGGYLYAYSCKMKICFKHIFAAFLFSAIVISLFNFTKYKYYELKTNIHKFYQDKRRNIYILEKSYVLNKKYGQPYMFICYGLLSEISSDAIGYLAYFYENDEFDVNSVRVINVCDTGDVMTCRKNMTETVKQRLGYTFTEEELQNPDFKSLFELNYDLNGVQKYKLK